MIQIHRITGLISFIACCLLFAACANPNDPSGTQVSNEADMLAYGKKVYVTQCIVCHGEKGNARISGAADLRLTKLDESSIGDLVYHGRKTMPPFQDRLGEPEINAVSMYVLSLKESK